MPRSRDGDFHANDRQRQTKQIALPLAHVHGAMTELITLFLVHACGAKIRVCDKPWLMHCTPAALKPSKHLSEVGGDTKLQSKALVALLGHITFSSAGWEVGISPRTATPPREEIQGNRVTTRYR